MSVMDRVCVFLSYLGFAGIFPPFFAYFFFAKSPTSRFHAKQGIFLTFFFSFFFMIVGIVRFVFIHDDWSSKVIFIGYGILYFVYILCNLVPAIFGLLGHNWAFPILRNWLKSK